jgi:hypothetical protein
VENQRAFVVFLIRLICVCGLLASILAKPTSAQTTTYTYTGNPLTSGSSGGCQPGCSVTGSFTVSQPLPANLGGPVFDGLITPVPVPSLASYSFSGGGVTCNNANSPISPSSMLNVVTNSSGAITSWAVELIICGSPDNAVITQTFAVPGDQIDFANDATGSGWISFNSQNPGTWTGSSATCASLLSNSITTSLVNGDLDDPLPTTMKATFTPQPAGSMTVLQAAEVCGYTNFDWQQTINSDPIQDSVRAIQPSPGCLGPLETPDGDGILGYLCPAPPPYLDPPPGGYTYENGGKGDQAFPLYWDAITDGGAELLANEPGGNVLNFTDIPGDPCLVGPLGTPSVNYLDFPGIRKACGSTAPIGSKLAFTTHLIGICGTASDYFKMCKSSFEPETNTNCTSIGTCVDIGMGPIWTSNYNGTVGGVGTIKNTLPPDAGSGVGGVTITNVQETPMVGTSATPSQTLTSGKACNGVFSGRFSGNITISAGQNCTFVNGTITGNIQANGGSLALSGVRVSGNVQLVGVSTFSIGPFAAINGDLQVQSIPAGTTQSKVCASAVSGDLQFQNNRSPVEIGSATLSSCAGNAIGGNLQVQNNAAQTVIDNNGVSGNLQDQNNGASSTIDGNTVIGNLQVQNDIGTTQVSSNVVKNILQCENNASISGGGNTAKLKQGQCSAF